MTRQRSSIPNHLAFTTIILIFVFVFALHHHHAEAGILEYTRAKTVGGAGGRSRVGGGAAGLAASSISSGGETESQVAQLAREIAAMCEEYMAPARRRSSDAEYHQQQEDEEDDEQERTIRRICAEVSAARQARVYWRMP